MDLKLGLNRVVQPGEKKALSATAAAGMEDAVLRGILEQTASLAGEGADSWTELALKEGLSPAIRAQLLEAGMEEKTLENEDAFAVLGEGSALTIWANTRNGWLYAACELLHDAQTGGGKISGGLRFAAPQCPFRGLKLYLPPKDGLNAFYRIVDMLLYYRYNTVILEVGGAMEYKRHPEINESWESYCREMARYPERADEVQNMFGWVKNSIHFENGGGSWLTQDTVRELIAYCRARGMEVIPEVPSLSHADYLLNAHPELAERSYDPFPDTYCPSNPDSYKLLFDVMDEVIDVFQPRVMQVGHDEIYSICVCETCRKRDAGELLAEDLTKIHDYLAQRGIRLMYWSEKMLNHITSWGEGLGGAQHGRPYSRDVDGARPHPARLHRAQLVLGAARIARSAVPFARNGYDLRQLGPARDGQLAGACGGRCAGRRAVALDDDRAGHDAAERRSAVDRLWRISALADGLHGRLLRRAAKGRHGGAVPLSQRAYAPRAAFGIYAHDDRLARARLYHQRADAGGKRSDRKVCDLVPKRPHAGDPAGLRRQHHESGA